MIGITRQAGAQKLGKLMLYQLSYSRVERKLAGMAGALPSLAARCFVSGLGLPEALGWSGLCEGGRLEAVALSACLLARKSAKERRVSSRRIRRA
jgi:hypothetical protein